MAEQDGGRADYAAMVTRAQAAVASVNDPELRRVAFEKILETLLRPHSEVPSAAPANSSRKTARKPKIASSAKRGGPQGYIEELVEDNFFKTPKSISGVRAELENRGHHIPLTSLSKPLQRLCQKRVLRRQKKSEGNKEGFVYTNW